MAATSWGMSVIRREYATPGLRVSSRPGAVSHHGVTPTDSYQGWLPPNAGSPSYSPMAGSARRAAKPGQYRWTVSARGSTGRGGRHAPTLSRRPPQQLGPHGEGEVRRLGLLTALYFWNGRFVPTAMGSSQSSGYGVRRVERRPYGRACRLEALTRGSTWATGASSALGARGRTARLCVSSARDQTSLVTGTAATTITPGAFSSNSFTLADSGATDGTSLSP
jgi:hypothetical protein